ncbi:MAG: hypothetical protein R2850_08235 [Bacteroidia bacterium]
MFEKLLQQIRKWLSSPSQADAGAVVQEMLVRPQRFKQQYRSWIADGAHHEVLKNIYTSFTLTHSGVSGDIPMHVFRNGSSRTVVIHYFDGLGKNIPAFLQDYFRDRVMRIGYNLFLSDRQEINRVSHQETVDRHVLRPYVPSFHINEKPEQLYGTISIAVHYADERPMFLEISSEVMHGGEFAPAFPFEELAEILFI